MDETLRDLERRYQESRLPDDLAKLERALARTGQGTRLAVERIVANLPEPGQITMSDVLAGLSALAEHGLEWYTLAGSRDFVHEKGERAPLVFMYRDGDQITIGGGGHYLSHPYPESVWPELSVAIQDHPLRRALGLHQEDPWRSSINFFTYFSRTIYIPKKSHHPYNNMVVARSSLSAVWITLSLQRFSNAPGDYRHNLESFGIMSTTSHEILNQLKAIQEQAKVAAASWTLKQSRDRVRISVESAKLLANKKI